MRSLRILMFTTFYPPYSFGGDAVGVQRMAQALAQRGHSVTVVHEEDAYLSLGGKVSADRAADGVEVIGLRAKFGTLSLLLTQQTGRPTFHKAQIQEVLDSQPWDIIWHNNTSLVGGPGLLPMGRGLKIYEAHEHWLVCPTHVLWKNNEEVCEKKSCLSCQMLSYKRPPQLWRYTGALDRALSHMDLIVSKSVFSANKHKAYGLTQDMTPLPYFLPDLDLADAPAPAQHPRPFFLFVGRLEKIKGLQDVFPVFDGPGSSDLIILGEGDYRADLERLAAGNPRIIFLGRKPLDELTAYYRAAQGLIVPSVCYETFGIILIESFRLGTPVIARSLGPFPEIVKAAEGGVLFETDDDLRAAIASFETDPEKRDRQGARARAAFEEFWREDKVLAAYGAELAKAAARKGDAELAKALNGGAFEHGSKAA